MVCPMLRLGLAALLLFAGCVTETTYPDSRTERSRKRAARTPPREGGTIKLPREIMSKLIGFVNEEKLLMGDKIEVDATRIPFQAAMVPVNDARYVETVELSNPTQKTVGMLIRSRARIPAVERDFPRLRIGDGTDLVANREIQVRIYNRIDPDRPVSITIVATGHAVFRNGRTGERMEKDRIVLRALVEKRAAGPVFTKSVS